MAREIDKRDPSANRTTPARLRSFDALAMSVSDTLPGAHRVSIKGFDAATGNPDFITSEDALAEEGNYVQRALGHVQSISTVLGLEETQSPEFIADPNVQMTSSGAATVHLQQQYKGIRIFQAAQGVRFNPDGAIAETVGSSITVSQEQDVLPTLKVEDATLIAARQVATPQEDEQPETDEFGAPLKSSAIDVSDFKPKIIATFPNLPESPTVLEAGPFGDEIRANLIWFSLNNTLRLGWEVLIVMPDNEGQYRTIVAADNGELLYCRQLMSTLTVRGNVYVVDGSNGRQMVPFPRPLTDYGVPVPVGLPDAFPDGWVSVNAAIGNAVNAFLGFSEQTVQGTEQDDVLTFDPDDPEGDDQKILNIFYYNCVIHDFLYLYGFREADGNFQKDNFGRGGVFADPVTAFAHSGAVNGTANMSTRVDGVSPVMNMGLVPATNRHTAFDSTVVFHEFMHGVTNRLVGGPMNTQALEDFQSAGMGEGWGDYIACTINKATVVGAWVMNNPGGIRKFPYDSNFPDNFGKLGTGRYNRPELNKQHSVGEIWCATLLEMNRTIGAHLGVQLVIDALKLSPVRPSFLDMRDSILRALDHKLDAGQVSAEAYATARAGIWATFAKFGMGPDARSNGASLTGIIADFNVPSTDALEPAAAHAGIAQPGGIETLSIAKETASSFGGGDAHADKEDEKIAEAFDDVLAAIRVHGEELAGIPNVVGVGPGYRFQNGNIDSQPVLSVTVLRKLDPSSVSARDLIPAKLGKVLVDVVPATPIEQLRFLARQDALAQGGQRIPAGVIDMRRPGESDDTDETAASFAGLLDYVPPAVALEAVEEEMTILCHASPDAGWHNLKQFIGDTKERLTATMYEFNARHILDALIDSLKSPRKLRLILDGGSPNAVPGSSQTTISKLAARDALKAALDQRFDCVWAPVRDAGMTTASYYPSAYHIKVAVRDGESFWLSSGNWKESGQPKLDPINEPLPPGISKAEFQSDHNREWHVIIQNRKLAELFETFINHDVTQARPLQKPNTGAAPTPVMPDLFIPEAGMAAFAEFAAQAEFFEQQEFKKKVRVQPLMTPDNFPEYIRPLIEGAKRKLYFQNQSLKTSNGNSRYMPLFRALRDKTKEAKQNPDLDVKILVSEYTDLTLLKTEGFEMSFVKKQYQCHNKGIIVDDEIVVVGSHNWTGPGATTNRDASLIIYDADITAYFNKFFLYDWNRIDANDLFMLSMPVVAMPGEATPPGMIRVAWHQLFPDGRNA